MAGQADIDMDNTRAIEELTQAVQAINSSLALKTNKSETPYFVGDMTILVSYVGKWSSGRQYKKNEIVSLDEEFYRCIEDNVGEEPPSDKWESYIATDGQKRLLNTFDDNVSQYSTKGVKSSGIWAWVKSLLPEWLTATYEEPATVESVNARYMLPEGGVPKDDLADDVRESLGRADSARDKTDLWVYNSEYPTEGQVWTWTNPDTGEEVSKSLNFRTLHYEDAGGAIFDFTGWIDLDGELAYPGQPYVRVSAGLMGVEGEVQVVNYDSEPYADYTAAATRAAPKVDPQRSEDTLAKSSDVAKKADWDGGWTNDVDNDKYTLVFEDPYGWGHSEWWIYENGSRREYAGSMGDESSESLTWHAYNEWDADFDITFTRRLVLRRGDPDVATRKDLAGKRGINDFSVFGEWECDYSDCEVRWNGDGWGLWFSPGGFWLSLVNKGDEKSVSLSWRLDDSEIQFGPETVTATRESDTLAKTSELSGKQDALTSAQLANIAAVPKKADELGEWIAHNVPSGVTPVGQPMHNDMIWFWECEGSDHTFDAMFSGEDDDNLSFLESGEPYRFFTATRKRVLRIGDAPYMTDLGNGRYEYVGSMTDASTRTYPREDD